MFIQVSLNMVADLGCLGTCRLYDSCHSVYYNGQTLL